MNPCALCPRACRVDRTVSPGRCGVKDGLRAARAALHFWEEPCISGARGSGTVFFSGCPLGCVFCQNYPISTGGNGENLTPERLARVFLHLQEQGAHNINLVNPTHQLPGIAQALEIAGDDLALPIVLNSGGYEQAETLRRYAGYIDVYLPDLKFYSSALSARYCGAADYFEYASVALLEMVRLAGPPIFDGEGLLQRGVCVRHLVMPGLLQDSLALAAWLGANFPRDGIVISLMRQYVPMGRASEYPEINRRVTTYEYEKVQDALAALDFQYVYTQAKSSASEDYVPPFNGEGLNP